MPIHLTKGLELLAALLAPVVSTVFFNWRALAADRQKDQRQVR
jgi:hypothetical protein